MIDLIHSNPVTQWLAGQLVYWLVDLAITMVNAAGFVFDC